MPTWWNLEETYSIRDKHARRIAYKKVSVKRPVINTFTKKPTYEEMLVEQLKKLKLV